MRSRLASLVLVALVLPAPALRAAPWHLLDVHSDTGLFFFDAHSVTRTGDTVSVWIRQLKDPGPIEPGRPAVIAAHDEFDCKARSIRTLQADVYARDGTLLNSDRRDKAAFFPEAGTPGDRFVTIACLADFPALNHPDLYSAVPGGDMDAYAVRYFAGRAKAPVAPPSSGKQP